MCPEARETAPQSGVCDAVSVGEFSHKSLAKPTSQAKKSQMTSENYPSLQTVPLAGNESDARKVRTTVSRQWLPDS